MSVCHLVWKCDLNWHRVSKPSAFEAHIYLCIWYNLLNRIREDCKFLKVAARIHNEIVLLSFKNICRQSKPGNLCVGLGHKTSYVRLLRCRLKHSPKRSSKNICFKIQLFIMHRILRSFSHLVIRVLSHSVIKSNDSVTKAFSSGLV